MKYVTECQKITQQVNELKIIDTVYTAVYGNVANCRCHPANGHTNYNFSAILWCQVNFLTIKLVNNKVNIPIYLLCLE
jgi:hypothetical protein